MTEAAELRVGKYRAVAGELRQLARERCRFDLCRRAQLFALAAGFDRFADRIERSDAKIAAG